MNITTLILSNGEEIIGRLKETTDTYITLEKPVKIVFNQKGIGFAPVCISADDASSFSFNKAHILTSISTRKEICDYYIQASTGIQLTTTL